MVSLNPTSFIRLLELASATRKKARDTSVAPSSVYINLESLWFTMEYSSRPPAPQSPSYRASVVANGQPSKTQTSPLPPLLALPLEVRHQIISYCVHHPTPTLAILRRTHSSFHNVIPKSDVRCKPRWARLREQLINARLRFPYLLPEDYVACFRCLSIVHLKETKSSGKTIVVLNKGLEESVDARLCLVCDKPQLQNGRWLRLVMFVLIADGLWLAEPRLKCCVMRMTCPWNHRGNKTLGDLEMHCGRWKYSLLKFIYGNWRWWFFTHTVLIEWTREGASYENTYAVVIDFRNFRLLTWIINNDVTWYSWILSKLLLFTSWRGKFWHASNPVGLNRISRRHPELDEFDTIFRNIIRIPIYCYRHAGADLLQLNYICVGT